MVTFLCLVGLCYGLKKLAGAAPSAIKFGMENREALRGGASVLKRMFGK